MKLQADDFELFDLSPRFMQDPTAIDVRWKALQREAHPDRFVAQGEAAQRLSLQWSVRINEAYRRLKDPLQRAAYLCELRGAPIDAERNTAMPQAFLIKQLQWRETLDEARDAESIEALTAEVRTLHNDMLQRLEALLDHQQDPVAAAAEVRGIMFIERFAEELEARLDRA